MIFIVIDVIALVVQAIGAGEASAAQTDAGTSHGARVMEGGIIIQLGESHTPTTSQCSANTLFQWRSPSTLHWQLSFFGDFRGISLCVAPIQLLSRRGKNRRMPLPTGSILT